MENTPLATFSVPPRMPQLSTLRRVLLAAYLRAAPPVSPPGLRRAGAAPPLTSARHVQQGPPDHMNLRRASPACPLSGSRAPLLALGGPRQTSGCGAYLSITTRHPSEEKPRRRRLRLVPRSAPFPPPTKQSPGRRQGAAPRRPGRALQELLHERDRHVHLADALLGLGDAARRVRAQRRQRGLAVRVAARRARRQRLLRCGQALHLRAEAAAGASPRGCSNTSEPRCSLLSCLESTPKHCQRCASPSSHDIASARRPVPRRCAIPDDGPHCRAALPNPSAAPPPLAAPAPAPAAAAGAPAPAAPPRTPGRPPAAAAGSGSCP